MIRLLRDMRPYIKECILGPLFKLLEASFELFIPLVVASVIDNGIAAGDTGFIVRRTGLMIVLGLIGLVCAITAQYFAAGAAVGFSSRIKSRLFSHLQTLSYPELDALGTSTMITRLTSDINQIQNGVNLVLRLFLRSPFIVFGAMVMAFTIDSRSALIFAGVIPLLSLIVFGVMLITMPLYRKVQKRLDGVTRAARENLYGARVIRAFNREAEEEKTFVKNNGSLTSMQKLAGSLSALTNPFTYVLINIAAILLIQTGAVRVSEGILSQGDVVALYNYLSQILIELIKLANLIVSITKAFACGSRVQSVLDLEPSITYPVVTAELPKDRDDTHVCFDHVSMTYRNAGAPSLSDISFSVRHGETVGIIGGTGSGKTSLVNLIPRFYDADQGRITIDGLPVTAYSKRDLTAKIGMVPQKAELFSGTIASNLRWGNPDASEEDLTEALRLAQAADITENREGGLSAPVLQGGSNFSGGQKQRLTIARALVHHPEILILDDSASALDYATDAALRRNLRTLPGHPTVFIVSQRTSSVRHADLILVLEEGNLVGAGTHEELLQNCPVYQEIHASQFSGQEQKAGAAV